MATQAQTGLTYQDLLAFPEDNLRRELIDGELIVTAAPAIRHQQAVLTLGASLHAYSKEHGGLALIAPTDVLFSEVTVLEPDVLFVTASNLDRVEENFIRGAPDIVVEVSSPSTRRLELVRKRAVYEGAGVPEYWYVDLDAERIEIYRLGDGGYPSPEIRVGEASIESDLLPGFVLSVGDVLRAEVPPKS